MQYQQWTILTIEAEVSDINEIQNRPLEERGIARFNYNVI